jgi:hypothetical protein
MNTTMQQAANNESGSYPLSCNHWSVYSRVKGFSKIKNNGRKYFKSCIIIKTDTGGNASNDRVEHLLPN